MKNAAILGIAALTIGLATPAFAVDVISAKDPSVILDLAKGYGSANLEKDSTGDPLIIGRIEGTKYGIYFYGCTNGKSCEEIQFVAAWGDKKISLEKLNDWNRTKRYGKAYLDKDGDPALEMSVNTDYGVTRRNLEDSFDWWNKALKGFKKDVLDI